MTALVGGITIQISKGFHMEAFVYTTGGMHKMKKFLMSMMAVALCAGVAIASEQGAAGKTCPMAKKDAKCAMKGAKCVCSGTVEAVDAATGKVTVKCEDGTTKELATTADTKVKVGKKKAAVAELKVGDPVEVVCKGEAVKSISVKTAKKNAMKREEKKVEVEK